MLRILFLVLLFGLLSTPGVATATPPPPTQGALVSPTINELIAQVSALRERLKFQLSGGLYLFYYQPIDNTSTLADGTYRGTFQVFYYSLSLDAEIRGFGVHTEMRMRDGGHVGPAANNTFFRGFYTSNFWFQEAYAYYTPGRYLKLKAGKVYRQVGIFWDDSFFGNLFFYDGVKLNPDYGVSLEGERSFFADRLKLGYSAQYFLQSDGINGGLDFARTIPSAMPTAGTPLPPDLSPIRLRSPNPEGERGADNSLSTVLRNITTARGVITLRPLSRFLLTVGGSFLYAQLDRALPMNLGGPGPVTDTSQMMQAGGDLTISAGPATIFAEYLRQFGPGTRDADYVLAGARVAMGPVSVRVNSSYVRYHLYPDIEEWELVPGLTYTTGYGLSVFLELDEWQRRDPLRTGDSFVVYDRSLNLALGYSF